MNAGLARGRQTGRNRLAVVGLLLALPVTPVFAARHRAPAAGVPAPRPAVTASQPPAFSISVEPLGFAAPGEFYQGLRQSLVSLDFLDESRLLFTFRAPGLLHRTPGAEGGERQIRALVLSLPKGGTVDEALWTLHGTQHYLWMLDGGHFLLRDGDQLREGNADLDLKPLLQFPGPLLSVEMDPSRVYLVTNSHEPAGVEPKPGQVPSPATAQAGVGEAAAAGGAQPDIVLRILRRATGQVMLVSRVRLPVRLPINHEGYVETLRGNGREWLLNLNYFTGGSRILGRVTSLCEPPVEFLRLDEVLVNTCSPDGGRDLVAVTTEGQRLWDAPSAPTQIWPLLVHAPDGSRVARETLTVNHAIGAYTPLSFDDVTGQQVEVLDSATGSLLLKAPASPVLDGGGNIAFSPSGQRVAVLNGGAIDVYDLPATPTAAAAPARSLQ